jgi:hypothetical protein
MISLTPSSFLEVGIASQESEQSCIHVVRGGGGMAILPLSTILLFDFRIVPTVWYFVSILLNDEKKI